MAKPSLSIWSLNGGRFVGKTPDEEPQTLKWLKSLSEPGAEVPDVLCLQDFRVSLLQYLTPLPHFHFAPMTNHKIWGKRELTGIVLASKYPLDDIKIHYTHTDESGECVIKDLEGVGDDNQRWSGDRAEEADWRVLETEWRVVIAATVFKPHESSFLDEWRVATHHGFWVRGGVATSKQMESTELLCDFLKDDARVNDGLIYIADCNLDKDGEVMQIYLSNRARDCLPSSIKTTVASHHLAAKFGAKPDRVMVFPDKDGDHTYSVSNVQVDDSPGSDHLLLKATATQED